MTRIRRSGRTQRLGLQRERQAEVGVEAALVELVEDEKADPLERGIGLDQAGEHALGDHLEPGARADPRVPADAVADGRPDRLAELSRHVPCSRARREPPRLEQHDAPPSEPRLVEQRERHPRRLAGARRRLQHYAPALAERSRQRRKRGFDRKAVHGAECTPPRTGPWPIAGRRGNISVSSAPKYPVPHPPLEPRRSRVTDTVVEIRRRAAERAKEVLAGTVSAREFCEEFGDVDDRAIAELIDLLEHEPPHGGLFDGGEEAWRNYQDSVRDIIDALEG